MNKRDFVIGSCTALTGAAAIAHGGTSVASGTGRAVGLRRSRLPDLASEVSGPTWQAYVGHDFVAGPAGAGQHLTLLEVSASAVHAPELEQFSLTFNSAGDAPLASGTYILTHATGQRVAVYLDASRGHAPAATRYRAHFSLMV